VERDLRVDFLKTFGSYYYPARLASWDLHPEEFFGINKIHVVGLK